MSFVLTFSDEFMQVSIPSSERYLLRKKKRDILDYHMMYVISEYPFCMQRYFFVCIFYVMKHRKKKKHK